MKHFIQAHFTVALLLVFSAVGLSACDSAEPGDDGAGEQELITRVVLTLQSEGETFTATASDPDGDGTDFQIETLSLAPARTYIGTIEVFDDVNDEDITAEIAEEDDEHQFFYEPGGTDASRLSVNVSDTDANGLPVGLGFTITISGEEPGDATLRVILSHYDDQPKDGVTRSDETDIDVLFPVEIQEL